MLAAAAFRGVTGFGYALVAAVGLSAFFSSQTMVPFILVTDMLITSIILLDRKHNSVDRRIAPFILGAGFLGAVCGGLLAGVLDETTTKLAVAAVVCLSALLAMAKHVPAWMAHRAIGFAAACAAGVLLAAFGVGGPLIAVWLLAGGTRRETTRGTMALFFGCIDGFSLMSRSVLGHVDPGLPMLLLAYLPLVVGGYFTGVRIGLRLSPLWWRRTCAIGLMLIALAGAAQTLHGLII